MMPIALSRSPSASVSALLQSIMPAPVRSRSSFTIAAVICIDPRSFPVRDRAALSPAPASRHPLLRRPLPRRPLPGVPCPGVHRRGVHRRGFTGAIVRGGRLHRRPPAQGALLRDHLRLLAGDLLLSRRPARTGSLAVGSGPGPCPGADRRRDFQLRRLPAFENGGGGAGNVKLDRANRVVIARNDVVDALGRVVRIDHRDDRNAQRHRLGHRDLLVADVDDEQHVGMPSMFLMPPSPRSSFASSR